MLGPDPMGGIVSDFYRRVFGEEKWFRATFGRGGELNHHHGTQGSGGLGGMGGGPYYHGAEYRLNFHHTHNAHMLLDEKGARRWVKLMVQALESSQHLMTDDPRVRLSINTFLAHFFAKYASDFKFKNRESFGETNPPFRPKINFMNMTAKSIEALSEEDLRDALIARGIDLGGLVSKDDLVQKALNL